jgi:hypothetical protein
MTTPAKKTYLKVKTGLFLDPIHRQKIGSRLWLFMYILHSANWETGTVDYWKDGDAAEKLDLPKRTVKDQRQGLEVAGYIFSLVKGQHQEIVVFNYLNPRTGEILNPKSTDEALVFMEEDQTEWDKKVSQSTDNWDKKVSQGGDFVPRGDTPAHEGDSKSVPLPLNLNIIKREEIKSDTDPALIDALQFALGELKLQGVNKADYESYLLPLKLKVPGNGSITLTIGNKYARELIEKRYLSQIQSVMSGRLGKPVSLRIETT